jgi:hypothetical protein
MARRQSLSWIPVGKGVRGAAVLPFLALTLLAGPVLAQGPATPNPMCPHLDTWNPKGIKGPNRIDNLIVRFPAGSASQRGGSCSILVDASYERERERSYSFLAAGQFLVNERFSRSSDRDSAVSGTRAFFLFPRPRRLTLESPAQGGVVTVRLDPVRIVEIGGSGFIRRMTGAVLEEAPAVTAMTQGGVVFRDFEGVVLDAGWGRGEVAFRKFPDAESTFTDRDGRVCSVPNRQIFDYSDRLHPVLAFGSDPQLARFLAGRCGPEFDVTLLHARPARVDVSVMDPPSRVPPPPKRPQPPR